MVTRCFAQVTPGQADRVSVGAVPDRGDAQVRVQRQED